MVGPAKARKCELHAFGSKRRPWPGRANKVDQFIVLPTVVPRLARVGLARGPMQIKLLPAPREFHNQIESKQTDSQLLAALCAPLNPSAMGGTSARVRANSFVGPRGRSNRISVWLVKSVAALKVHRPPRYSCGSSHNRKRRPICPTGAKLAATNRIIKQQKRRQCQTGDTITSL